MRKGVTDVMVRATLQKTANRAQIHRPVTIVTNQDTLPGRVQNQETDKTVTNATNRGIYQEIVPKDQKHVIPATDRGTLDVIAILIIKSSKNTIFLN